MSHTCHTHTHVTPRHSLALVGDVPEFRQGRSQLASLEDRLQRRVEGRLREALAVRGARAGCVCVCVCVGRGRM
jgi:hypothetical protein